MKDILTTPDGDLAVTATGDISLTDSIRQAVRIRLLWYLAEWRFAPQYGVPYFEEILVKNPGTERIKTIIRETCMSVDEIKDVRDISVKLDAKSRETLFSFVLTTDEGSWTEEVKIRV
jgi:hypothetical protein